MNKKPCKNVTVLSVALVAAFLVAMTGVCVAQADTFTLHYYANGNTAGAPDATLRIDNTGDTYGNLCAMIYVFTADQQMTECCGCVNSHNNLATYSVNGNLLNNPLTGVLPVRGAIKIVSAAVNAAPCDPTTNVTPTPELRSWATHVQNKVGNAFPITETPGLDSTLGAVELANLQAQCAFIGILGSGAGVCNCPAAGK